MTKLNFGNRAVNAPLFEKAANVYATPADLGFVTSTSNNANAAYRYFFPNVFTGTENSPMFTSA